MQTRRVTKQQHKPLWIVLDQIKIGCAPSTYLIGNVVASGGNAFQDGFFKLAPRSRNTTQENTFPGSIVLVDNWSSDTRGARDILDRDPLISELGKKLLGYVQQLLLSLYGRQAHTLRLIAGRGVLHDLNYTVVIAVESLQGDRRGP